MMDVGRVIGIDIRTWNKIRKEWRKARRERMVYSRCNMVREQFMHIDHLLLDDSRDVCKLLRGRVVYHIV